MSFVVYLVASKYEQLWHKNIIITNNLKCQSGLHHCDKLVETIEMDISFDNFGVRMQEILKEQFILGC
jgi:hypothetical protein